MAQLIAVVPAAGGGARFGASLPKQYASLDGTTVLECTLRRLQQSVPLDATFVVLAPDDVYFDRLCARLPGVVALRCGGPTRGATVRKMRRVLAFPVMRWNGCARTWRTTRSAACLRCPSPIR
jgi:2-C-methyl-D-erythritol 4-phosphate cytidylyltransferase